jgi:erythrin-vacuolar iron transport family protein
MVMAKEINFSEISLKDALDLAILIEEEAKERYEEFVDQMKLHHTPDAAEFFRQMSANEEKHRAGLFEQRRLLFHEEPTRIRRSMLWDVEAPDYDQTRAFMTARKAMEVALQCEIKAHDFFVRALDHIADDEVRSLFLELRDEESLHQELVRRAMQQLPVEPEVDPDAYEDEPTAQ